MNNFKKLFLLIGFTSICALSASADTIYNCENTAETSIGWDKSKPSMIAKANKSPTRTKTTFVVKKDGALVKGNAGQNELTKVGTNSFTETTGAGNTFLWNLVPGKDGAPTYLFQMKGYDLAGPFTTTIAWKCD